MSVRRGTARLVTAGALLAGLAITAVAAGVVTASPARAAEDSVRVRLPSSFTAGGSPGSTTVGITKRTEGCAGLRSALGIRLSGLAPDQVLVETAVADGGWRAVATSAGGADLVVTQRTRPARPTLCAGKSVTVRYRLTFGDAAPNGTVLVVGEVYTAEGAVLGRDSDSARVRGGRPAAAPTLPAVVPTSVAPTPEATEETEVAAVVPVGPATSAAAAADDNRGGAGFFGLSTVFILFGVAMVGLGVALLVLLIRRGRAERPAGRPTGVVGGPSGGHLVAPAGVGPVAPAGAGGPGGGAEATAYLPRTFRAGQPIPPAGQPIPSAGQPIPPAGQRGDATLILPTSVPPRPTLAQSGHPGRPGTPARPADAGPDATLFLPTDRSPRPRPDR